MAKNISQQRDSEVAIAAAVASGTVSGDIVALGTAGLFGLALTDRYVAANFGPDTLATPPQGLADGEATVRLVGVAEIVELTADATGLAQYAKVYWDASNGVITATSTSNTFIGYALEAISGAATGKVALRAA